VRHKRHSRRFWQNWQGEQPSAGGPEAETPHNPRDAWQKHFSDFLGVEPETHWLFGGRRFKSWASGEWGPPGLFNPFIAMLFSKGGGLLSLYMLHLLQERPRFGNDIMHEIESRTHGRWGANPGAIYPMLSDIEEAGLVEGAWEDPEKRTRRIYRITPRGQEELDRLKEVMRPKLEEAIDILRDLYEDLEKGDEP
jgi:PadR family transcriptional regulator PadR